MKTAVPNLHLNLNGPQIPSPSPCEVQTPIPITPMEQINPPRMTRIGSVSSQTSMNTDDEDRERDYPDHEWTFKEDELLMKTYQDVVDNPMVAPFAGRIPPSGIVHKVAKVVTKQAPLEGISFQHSLAHVRRRLLLLCHRQSGESSPQAQMNYRNQQHAPVVPPVQFEMGTPASSRPTTPVEPEARNQEIQFWLMQQPSQAPSPPPPQQSFDFQFPPRVGAPSGPAGNRPLASPFQESLAPAHPMTYAPPPHEDPFHNMTAHRKKESLKMRRMNGK